MENRTDGEWVARIMVGASVLWFSLLGVMLVSGLAGKFLWNSGFVGSMFFIPGVLAVVLSIAGLGVMVIATVSGARDVAANWTYCLGLLLAGCAFCEIGICFGLFSGR